MKRSASKINATASALGSFCLPLLLLGMLGWVPTTDATDFYWSGGSSVSDNIDQGANWWSGTNPSSGDNLYFNNTSAGTMRQWPYCNYGTGAWFGNIIVYNNALSIRWRGDQTYCYEFCNDNNPALIVSEATLANRTGPDTDLIMWPGGGGLQVSNVVLQNGKQLQINTSPDSASSTMWVMGTISQSGSGNATLGLNTAATLVLTNFAETYLGDTFVNNGTLQLSVNNGLANSGNFLRLGDTSGSAGANLNLLGGLSLSTPINVRSGSSGPKIIANTSGSTGTATFAGNLSLDAGAKLYANSSGSITLSGTTLDLKAQTLTVDGAGNSTISGTLQNSTGSGALTKNGTGTLTLSGANTYTGGTTLNAGTLQLGNASALGTGTFTITGGSLDSSVANQVDSQNNSQNWNGDFTFAGTQNLNLGTGAVTLNANRQVTVTANTLTVGGVTGGGYSLTKAGSGTLTLSGANTYTGTTTISAGTLTYSGSGASLGTANYALLVGGATGNGVLNLNSSGTFNYGTNANVTDYVGGANGPSDTGAGAVNQSNGTVTMGYAGSSTYTYLTLGATTTGSAPFAYGSYNLSGGSLTVPSGTNNAGIRVGYGGLGSFVQSGGTLSCARYFAIGADNGSGYGKGVATFTGGNATISSSSYYFTVPDNIGTATLNIGTQAGGTALVTSLGTSYGIKLNYANGGAGTVNLNSGTLQLSGPISRANSSGTGTVNLNGATLQAGATSITLINNNNSPTVNVFKGGAVFDSHGNAATVSANLLATPGNGIYPSGGTLAIASGQSGSAGGSGYIGAPLVTVSGGSGSGAMAIANVSDGAVTGVTMTCPGQNYAVNDTLTFAFVGGGGTGASFTYKLTSSDLAANNGGLSKLGSGTVTLSGANTYSGGTTIKAGTLTISGGSSGTSGPLGPNTANVYLGDTSGSSAATLAFSSTAATHNYPLTVQSGSSGIKTMLNSASTAYVWGGTIALNDSLTLDSGSGSGSINVLGAVTGNGGLTVNMSSGSSGYAQLSATSSANTYAGNTTISSGTLRLGSATAIPNGSGKGVVSLNPSSPATATFDLSGNNQTINGLSSSGTGTAVVDNVSGQSKTLTVGTSGSNPSGTFAGVIQNSSSGTLTLAKAGTGTLTLSGPNTYSGATTVSAGTLLVNNTTGSGTGTGAVTASGGTLGGNGIISGAFAVASGGTLAPSGTFPATLTVNNTLGLAGNATFRINKSGTTYTSDLVAGITTLTAGGTLNVTLNSGSDALAGGESFKLFNATTSYGSTTPTAGTMPSLPSQTPALNWYLGNLPVDGTITVNRAPSAADKTYTRTKGMTVKIPKAELMVGASDPDSGDSVNYDGLVSLTSSQGVTVSQNSTYYFYVPINDNNDTLQYKVKDNRGGLTTKYIYINVGAAMGQAQGIALVDGKATVKFAGIPGYTYIVERATDVNFTENLTTMLTTNLRSSSDGLFTYVDDGPPANPSFYRLKYNP